MKNFKKVLRTVSEADFERYFSNPEIRRCSGKISFSKQYIVDFEKT